MQAEEIVIVSIRERYSPMEGQDPTWVKNTLLIVSELREALMNRVCRILHPECGMC